MDDIVLAGNFTSELVWNVRQVFINKFIVPAFYCHAKRNYKLEIWQVENTSMNFSFKTSRFSYFNQLRGICVCVCFPAFYSPACDRLKQSSDFCFVNEKKNAIDSLISFHSKDICTILFVTFYFWEVTWYFYRYVFWSILPRMIFFFPRTTKRIVNIYWSLTFCIYLHSFIYLFFFQIYILSKYITTVICIILLCDIRRYLCYKFIKR